MTYQLDDNPHRVPRDQVWDWLCENAYWGRSRTRTDFDTQLNSAWRILAAYRDDTGDLVGFARAVSDGVSFGYLADVFVYAEHRGTGLGKRMVQHLTGDARGRRMRWILFTNDAHGVYRNVGFTEPDSTVMVRMPQPDPT